MEPMDRAEESRRVEEFYAHMSNGELRALADKLNELTEVAQHALQAEISRRGLRTEIRDARTDDPVTADEDLVALWRAKDLAEARFVKTILDSAGIASSLAAESAESVDASSGSLEDDLIVRVVKSNLPRAFNALAPYFPQEEEGGKEYVARCPKCNSPDIIFQSLDSEPPAGSVAHSKFNWTCDACGHKWKDDGLEHES